MMGASASPSEATTALASAFLRGYRSMALRGGAAVVSSSLSYRLLATTDDASAKVDESLFWVALQALTAIFVMMAAFSLAFVIRANSSALNNNVLNLTARQYQPV